LACHPGPAALYLFVSILLVAASLLCLGMLVVHLRARQRQLLLLRLLDRTDALEEVLHATRKRMNAMKSVVERVPSDIAAVAQASLDADTPVQQGLRNVLEHRLWIAKNAATAGTHELHRAVDALERSHQQIASRLQQLEDAGAELAEATRPVVEQQAREPAALRRSEPGTDAGG
jgi:predicted  nucleic acid-binding Zn-ribbon protein